MKAVLVIDVPECICTYCPIYNMGDLNDDYRNLWCSRGCLLKPLPQKRESKEEWLNEYHRDEFADGWNACLNEITGEKEWNI